MSSWPDLTADIEPAIMGGATRADRPARVAIASYEFVGIVRNGGIGTACTELALALARDGHEVDLVFTGWGENAAGEGFERWRNHYEERGVRLHGLDLGAVSNGDAVLYNAVHSLALYRLLRELDAERPFDAIHFVESLGHGFYSLLAKRQGLAFARATTVVCAHSPRRWLAEAHAQPFDHPVELGDEFLERRSLELADVAVAPSAHMLDWLAGHGVQLPERSYVQQYVSGFERAAEGAAETIEELVFFGRLEPRKGLYTFCDALDLLVYGSYSRLRKVTFLGKEWIPAAYLHERAHGWPWECAVVSDLDREEALTYLRGPGRLAVMASTMDNSPNTVYEAIGLGIPFLASRGGGTAELVHPDDYERVTYDPRDGERDEIDPGNPAATKAVHTGRALVRRLELALANPQPPARFAVEPGANREAHLEWHRAIARLEPEPPPAPADTPRPTPVAELASLDGADLSELLLLVDADLSARPALGAVLAGAALADPGAGFLTPLGAFEVLTPTGPATRVFLPTGGPAASGLLGNCAGAGAVLARREALARVGAFDGGDATPRDVADLLALAVVRGERVDVVPEVLYELPPVPGGALSTARDHFETLRPYMRGLPPAARDIAALAAHGARLFGQGSSARTEEAELRAEALARELAVLRASHSLRLTAPLRTLGEQGRGLLRRSRRPVG